MKMDYEEEKIREEDIELLQDKMKQILDCSMQRYCHEWVTVPKRGYVYGIMNFSPKNIEKIRNMLRECLNQLEAQKRLLGAVDFSLGIGEIVNDTYQEFSIGKSNRIIFFRNTLVFIINQLKSERFLFNLHLIRNNI